ncbi:hypothetical protein FGO68_gene8816 [Halteria grandinella]|uniref:Uncharacterized protein n=1 Tax=Halteria grandinella TaxID=5974 RepID=A0A8J8P0W7_HALGN|nr:hypothetical protein FGO68_gene8816 [Halteria grandinella]
MMTYSRAWLPFYYSKYYKSAKRTLMLQESDPLFKMQELIKAIDVKQSEISHKLRNWLAKWKYWFLDDIWKANTLMAKVKIERRVNW